MPSWLILLLEIVFVGLIVAGVALVYVPAAFVLAGVAGVLACERGAVTQARRLAIERRAER